ncbi:unnamed protein product, partial [Brassica oleracea]
ANNLSFIIIICFFIDECCFMQKRGSISNQSIPTLRMREEMSTLDYILMVS